jgi:hypothetical protein
VVEVVGGEDEEKGDGGDGDFADGSYDEGAGFAPLQRPELFNAAVLRFVRGLKA